MVGSFGRFWISTESAELPRRGAFFAQISITGTAPVPLGCKESTDICRRQKLITGKFTGISTAFTVIGRIRFVQLLSSAMKIPVCQ